MELDWSQNWCIYLWYFLYISIGNNCVLWLVMDCFWDMVGLTVTITQIKQKKQEHPHSLAQKIKHTLQNMQTNSLGLLKYTFQAVALKLKKINICWVRHLIHHGQEQTKDKEVCLNRDVYCMSVSPPVEHGCVAMQAVCNRMFITLFCTGSGYNSCSYFSVLHSNSHQSFDCKSQQRRNFSLFFFKVIPCWVNDNVSPRKSHWPTHKKAS